MFRLFAQSLLLLGAGMLFPVVGASAAGESPAPPVVQLEELLEALRHEQALTGGENALLAYFEAALLARPFIEPLTVPEGGGPAQAARAGAQATWQAAVEKMTRGAAMAHAAWPPLPADARTGRCLPARLAVEILKEGEALERRRDSEGACARYLAVLRVAAQLRAPGAPLSDSLAALRLESRACSALFAFSTSGKLSDETLSELASAVAELEGASATLAPTLARYLDLRLARYQAALRDQQLERFFTDPSSGRGPPPERLRSLAANPEGALGYLRESHAFWKSNLAAPYRARVLPESEARDTEWVDRFDLTGGDGLLLRAGIWSMHLSDLCNRAELGLLRAALALERHWKAAGSFPDELSALVPRYLPALPRDPFAARPLGYRREAQGYRLYSVGPDGVSQGGRTRYNPLHGAVSPGDLVREVKRESRVPAPPSAPATRERGRRAR